MKKLHIDIETFCDISVSVLGTYKYAAHPSFRIVLLAYAWDDEPVEVIDCYDDEFPGESVPIDVMAALRGEMPEVELWAHNANFERVCCMTYYGIDSPIERWRCTMITSAYLGLPLQLDQVGKVLHLTEQKDAKGKALIKFFCGPVPSRKKEEKGQMIINSPKDYPEKWELFKGYNAQDVRVEREIEVWASRFPPMPDIERKYWQQDQEINAEGIAIDTEFVRAAIRTNRRILRDIHTEMIEITGVENPNSLSQLKEWLRRRGHTFKSIDKVTLSEVLKKAGLPLDVLRVLHLRQMSSRTSTSKYETMMNMLCDDGKIRGQIQYYGANRTGRYAGRGVQVHNLKKTFSNEAARRQAPHLIADGLEIGKAAIVQGIAELLYDDVPELISQLVRTGFISDQGHSLVVSDFASIEAIIVAWLAGEQWVLEAFRNGIDLYAATASRMFDLPLEVCGKGSVWRPKGKVSVLGLGYQGSVGALITMGALKEGLLEEELPAIVDGYRKANKNIVKFWHRVEDAARHVIRNRTVYVLKMPQCKLTFGYEKGYLYITLPSGRRLYYYGAHLAGNRIRYWGLDQVKKIWTRMDAYGGLLVENITQAVARDILADSMYRMRGKVRIAMHVHDEIISQAKDSKADETLQLMERIMSTPPWWATDLPLRGEGYISKYYKKD